MIDQFHIELSGLLHEARDLLNSGRPELAEAIMDEAEKYYRRTLKNQSEDATDCQQDARMLNDETPTK
ncbi:hypothetical protein [Trichococcus shcherbakoviae]|uniref:hypothetical protein n=1 Tax=Trichococcus shcherbakoviae TaxID=2094020 RepID=UPI002AA8CAB4|nr:hypothetical protein [Trichococcus shcherbakoviae]